MCKILSNMQQDSPPYSPDLVSSDFARVMQIEKRSNSFKKKQFSIVISLVITNLHVNMNDDLKISLFF